jgi:predicted phosphodiesterase
MRQETTMRLLLISDTHGKLDVINELATRTRADAVIHAGEFGFYDDSSYERLSERELEFHVRHSELLTIEKEEILALPRVERIQAMKVRCPLSDFPSYVSGEKIFEVPVYAVWGNHEDKTLVDSLFRGETKVDKLFVVHHGVTYRVGDALVFGIGGNFLPGSKLLQRPIAGGSGRIWSTLAQYTELIEMIDR